MKRLYFLLTATTLFIVSCSNEPYEKNANKIEPTKEKIIPEIKASEAEFKSYSKNNDSVNATFILEDGNSISFTEIANSIVLPIAKTKCQIEYVSKQDTSEGKNIYYSLLKVQPKVKCKFLKPKHDDSCFIIRHILEEDYQQEYLTFLDKKHWNESKNILSDFTYHISEYKSMYPSYYDIKKGREQSLIPIKLPKKWLSLRQYNGKLVLHRSIEYNTRFYLTDSTFTEFEMGGPYTKVIKEATLVNGQYHLKLYEPYDSTISELNIRIIDKKRGIALWESKNKYGSSSALFIPAESVPLFDIIGTISYDAMMEPGDVTKSIDIKEFLKSIE
jgi:hypothetical protein